MITTCPVDCVLDPWSSTLLMCPVLPGFSANSAATFSFFHRAVFFSLFLLTRHQCIAFPFKVNSTEPNFILDSVTLWNYAPQK